MENKHIQNLKINEDVFLKLKKRKKILEQGTGHFTGYPSIDMPWLKYYSEEQIMSPIPHNLTVYEYLRLLNNNNLSLTAIEFMGEKITYKELFEKINTTAKALISIGVKPGEIVTIMLPACPEEIYLFYALDLIGGCANFVFPGTSLLEVQETMENFSCDKLIILDDILNQPNNLINNNKFKVINKMLFGEQKNKGTNILKYDEFYIKGKNTELPNYKKKADEPLFIAKTGGTTGKPKCVILSDKSFNLQAHQHLNADLGYSSGDRWLRMWSLFSASAAVSSCHLPLCYGMTLILEPIPDIERIDEVLLRTKPNHMPLIASCIETLVNSEILKPGQLSFMKSIGIGGEGVTPEFEIKADEFAEKHKITNCMTYGYGMTENGSGASSRFNKATSTIGSVGIPQINTIISIFDPETKQEKKYGEEGEVCVLSSTFMLGYHNDIDSTNAVLQKHNDGLTWLHSGDLGMMDENGHLFIKGRIKRVISLFSANKIFPLELESIIETIPEVERAIVVAECDEMHPGFLKPCCFITLNTEISKEELLRIINKECFKGMPDYIKIDTIHIREDLPHTDIGKVNIKKLEEEAMTLSKRNN